MFPGEKLMGWLAALEWTNLKLAISTPGIIWLTGGGIAYTLGITFYALDHQDKFRHAQGV